MTAQTSNDVMVDPAGAPPSDNPPTPPATDDEDWIPARPYARRNEGIHVVSGRGTGKSVLLTGIARDDILAGIPVVVFDPSGDVIDRIFHKLYYGVLRKIDSQRLEYVNMAGMYLGPKEWMVKSFPLLFRYDELETHDTIAARFVDALRRLHPELERAQVQGMPWVEEAGMTVGIELSRRGLQFDSADVILDNPDLIPKGKAEQFRLRVRSILRNPLLRTMYTTTPPALDWDYVIKKKSIVLLDFRDLKPPTGVNHRFAFIWAFWYLMNFLDKRGANYTEPISVIVDELKALTTAGTAERQQVFADDFDYILNTLMRQRNIWLTVAHQQMMQFSEQIQGLLMGMGTQVIGRPETKRDAQIIAQELYDIDPNKVKRYDDVYGSGPLMAGSIIETKLGSFHTAGISGHEVIGEREVDYSIAEQHHTNAQELLALEQFHFYVRHAGERTFRHLRSLPHEFVTRKSLIHLQTAYMYDQAKIIDISGDATHIDAENPPAADSQADGKEQTNTKKSRFTKLDSSGTLE